MFPICNIVFVKGDWPEIGFKFAVLLFAFFVVVKIKKLL